MEAIGLLETIGLVGAIDAVDSMLKSARVSLLKKEITGGGLVTVVVAGMVADVRTAIDVGAAVCDGRGCLVSSHVIARASGGVGYLLCAEAEAHTKELPKEKAPPEPPKPPEEEAPPEPPKPPEEEAVQEAPEEETTPEASEPPAVVRAAKRKSREKNSYTRDYLMPLSIKQLRRLLKAENTGEAEGASVEFLSKAALIKELMKNSINEEEAQ